VRRHPAPGRKPLPQGPAPVMHPLSSPAVGAVLAPSAPSAARTCGLLLRRPLRSGTDRVRRAPSATESLQARVLRSRLCPSGPGRFSGAGTRSVPLPARRLLGRRKPLADRPALAESFPSCPTIYPTAAPGAASKRSRAPLLPAAGTLSPRQRRSTSSSSGRRLAREIHSSADRLSGFHDRSG
jgi:hypothetical protein